MGTKYLPTTKDLRASQRFQQKHHTTSKFIKAPAPSPAKPGKDEPGKIDRKS